MEDVSTYEELAHDLLDALSELMGRLTPVMVNATRGETGTLMTLYRAAAPLTPGQLAERAHVSSARVASILRALEEKGLVSREHSTADRRQVEVTLTDEGRATAQRTRDERNRAIARYLGKLGRDDAESLVRIVRRTSDIAWDRAQREGGAR